MQVLPRLGKRSRSAKPRSLVAATLLGLALALVAVAPQSALRASDWPQYRGPNRDGRSSETGLLTTWSEEGPEVLWRVPLGAGYSGIAVVGGRLYTMFGSGEEEYAAAFDTRSGNELWRFRMDAIRRDGQGDGPRATPTVTEGLVFVIGARAKLYALDAETGTQRWTVDLQQQMAARVPRWGYSSSPLVEGDLLVVEVGGDRESAFAAFDPQTGELAWRSGSDAPGYSSPLAVTLAGQRQLVFFTAAGLRGLAAADGRALWGVPWTTSYDVNASMPVFVPRDGIFISSGYDTGAAMFRIRREDGVFEVDEVWRNRVMKNHFNSSVLVGAHLYGFDMAILKCLDANSGQENWRARGGFSKGSLLYADGHLIVLGGNGTLAVVEATPEAFRLKARSRILESKTWTMPSLANGVLYVRDFRELLAVKVGSG